MSEVTTLTTSTDKSRFNIVVHGQTDVGRQRKHNEDHVLLRLEQDLFVVADGMGGHNAGDVASKLATTSLGNFYEATQAGDVALDSDDDDERELPDEARRLSVGIRKANADVYEISSTFQQHQGMGSTVVAMSLNRVAGMMSVGHVGDSRCYRLRQGEIEQLTRDHSLVNDALAMKPDLTEDELSRLPKNIITRALGMKDAVKVDMRTEKLQDGDIFLLCSDGLSGMVTDEEMLDIVSITDDLEEACDLLISLANDAGGTDNITVVLVRSDAIEGAPALAEDGDDGELEVSPSSLPADFEGMDDFDEDEDGDEEAKKCPTCGHAVFMGNAFCVECGTSV